MENYASYEDKLCVQFMARILQLKLDYKPDDIAIEIALRDFDNKMVFEQHPKKNRYLFIDGSTVEYFERNNVWECNDNDECKDEGNNFDFNLN